MGPACLKHSCTTLIQPVLVRPTTPHPPSAGPALGLAPYAEKTLSPHPCYFLRDLLEWADGQMEEGQVFRMGEGGGEEGKGKVGWVSCLSEWSREEERKGWKRQGRG